MPQPPHPLVVIVEDDAATLTAMGRVLRAVGFDIASYRSGEDFFAAPPDRLPYCVVVDVGLGTMSGLDLQRRLAMLGSSLPVIVMTGYDDPRIRAEATRMGCAGYVEKSSDIDVLLDRIRAIPPLRDDVR